MNTTDNEPGEALPDRIWINPSVLISDLRRERARISIGKVFNNDIEFVRAPLAAVGGDGSMSPKQLERAALIAESRHIDLATAQELVYLRDRAAASSPAPAAPLQPEGEQENADKFHCENCEQDFTESPHATDDGYWLCDPC